MAKNRKNVSVFDLPQNEVQQAAKQVQQETMVTMPSTRQEIIAETPPADNKVDKLKIIYVDISYHSQAKATAALRGMKLGEYIEHLIEKDTKG
jgi:beta-lactam-binding protein with PASTA domain